jgi:hypothetical protein
MTWVALRYLPGFAVDLTCWRISIERNGVVRREVHSYPDGAIRVSRGQLDSSQVRSLEAVLAATDFVAVAELERRHPWDDVSSVHITVIDAAEMIREFNASLEMWRHERNRQPAALAALALWDEIERLAPGDPRRERSGAGSPRA